MTTGYHVEDVVYAFVMIKDYCPDYNPKEYRKTKKMPITDISEKGHSVKIGKCYHLAKAMIENGAKKSEISRAAKYLWVMIDANKLNLDYKRAYTDLGIEKLGKKYYPQVSML